MASVPQLQPSAWPANRAAGRQGASCAYQERRAHLDLFLSVPPASPFPLSTGVSELPCELLASFMATVSEWALSLVM